MTTVVRRLVVAAMLAGAVASCTLGAPGSPSAPATQSVCDGISSDVGGCANARHRYTASTCDGIAREWGQVLDRAVLAVLSGPDEVDAQAKSVRLRQALVIATADMNQHLEDLRLQEDCDLPEFLEAAEPALSEELRRSVGGAMYDGLPVADYNEWLEDVRRVARVIDEGE